MDSINPMLAFPCVPSDMPHDFSLGYHTLLIQTHNWSVFWIPPTSFYIYLLRAHMCVWVQVCQSTQVETKRSTDNLQESVLSFLYMDPRAWTQVDRHGSKWLYPFGHFDCPYSPKVCMLHLFFFLNFPPFLFDSSLYSKDIWDHFIFKTSLLPISFLFILWLLFLLHCYVQRLICLLILNNFYLFICECTHMCVCACTVLHMHTVSREVRRELWMWTEVMGSCQSQMWVLGTKCGFSRASKHS